MELLKVTPRPRLTERTLVRLSPDVDDRLAAEAMRLGVPKAEAARLCIEQVLLPENGGTER